MRITDDLGNELPCNSTGDLEVRGSVVFSQNLSNPEATRDTHRHGEWFFTGDQGQIDPDGYLSLTGRTKELLIVNGVDYTPQNIETTLEGIEGTKPSFTLVFSYCKVRSDTENICVIYCPTYDLKDATIRTRTNDMISSTILLQIGVRPLIIPLDEQVLQKSTLGKLSRAKIKTACNKGILEPYRELNEKEMDLYRTVHFEEPSNKTEEFIIEIFKDTLGIPSLKLGALTNLFTLGISSINLITIIQRIKKKLKQEIPTIAIISNPTAHSLAATLLQKSQKPREYDPLIILQSQGSKAPLWLIHPGVGEILVFLTLASQFRDRPIYAFRARGFEENEQYFQGIGETIATYHRRIREVQPDGPYAIAGYSFSSMLAFEIAKLLYADEVRFLGIL